MEMLTESIPIGRHNGIKSSLSYRCNICREKFANIPSLDTHMLLHDLQKPYRCNYCPCSYGNIKALQVHAATHNIDMPYACDRCDEIFCASHELQSHVGSDSCQKNNEKQCENKSSSNSNHPGLRTRHNSVNRRVSYCDDEDDFVDDYLDDYFVNETMVTAPGNQNSVPATNEAKVTLPQSQNNLTATKKATVKSPNVLTTTIKKSAAGDDKNPSGYVSLSNLSVSKATNKSFITKPVSDTAKENVGVDSQPVVLPNNHRLFSAYIPLTDVGKLKNNKSKVISKNRQALKSLKKAKLSGVKKSYSGIRVPANDWSICSYCCEVHKNIQIHHDKHRKSVLERCGFCHLKLATRYTVHRHCRSTHVQRNRLHCKFCHTFIGSEQKYVKHYLERHADKEISNIQQASPVKPPIATKIKIKLENADEVLTGSVCVKCCEVHVNLSHHRCAHPTDHRKCGFCYMVLESDSSLMEHYVSEHQNKGEFACMICGLFLGSEKNYKKHFVDKHSASSNHNSNKHVTVGSKTTDVANNNNINMTAVTNSKDINMTDVTNSNDINITAVINSNDMTDTKLNCFSDETPSMEPNNCIENDSICCEKDDLDNDEDNPDFSESDQEDWFMNDLNFKTNYDGEKQATKLSICSFCCEVHPDMKHHQFTHSPEILKTCGFCSMKLATKNSVIRHCKLVHKRKKKLQCMLCVNIFPGSETNYIKHFLEFHPSKYTKGVDKDLVEFESDADESQSESSSDYSSDVSEDCQAILDSDTKLYICEFCCEVTPNLKSHQRDHSNLELKKCGFCSVVLCSKGSIQRHYHQVHRKRKEVDCKICRQMIGSEKRYIKHYLTVHSSRSAINERLVMDESPDEDSDDEHRHVCHMCCEVVQIKLSYHEYTHHEDAISKCGFCDTVLATKGSLKRHYDRVHKNKGEFLCKFCKKYVGSERNYKKHFLRDHSGTSSESSQRQKSAVDAANDENPIAAACVDDKTDITTEEKSDTAVMPSITTKDIPEKSVTSPLTTHNISETTSVATKEETLASENKMMSSSVITNNLTESAPLTSNDSGFLSNRVSTRKLKHMSICEFCCEVHSKIKWHRFCHAQSTLTRCGFCGCKLATKNSVIRHYQKVHLEKHRLFCLICNQMIGTEDDYKMHFLEFHIDKTSDVNVPVCPEDLNGEGQGKNVDKDVSLISNNSSEMEDVDVVNSDNSFPLDQIPKLPDIYDASLISNNSSKMADVDVVNSDNSVPLDQIPKLPDISDNHDNTTSSDPMAMSFSDDSDWSMPEISSSDDDDDEDYVPSDSQLPVSIDSPTNTAVDSKNVSSFPKAEILEVPPLTSTMDEKTSETSSKKVEDKMKICRHCCEVRRNLKGHRYEHTQSELYLCGFCGKTFNSRDSSSKHYRLLHKSCNNLVCRFCNDFIGSEEEYIQHIVTKHEDKGPEKALPPFPAYVLQLRRERRTKFSVCEYCCEVHKNLGKHYKTHLPVMFGTCGFCGEVVNVTTSAKDHYHEAHREAKNFNCKVCKTTLNSETAYKKHYRSRHSRGFSGGTDEQEDVILPIRGQYHCTVCDKAFTRERVFRRHRLSHLEKHIKCDVCNEVFYGDRMLKIHKSLNHVVERESCQICLKTFANATDLKTHEKIEHVGDKNFLCHFCTKTYCSRMSLKQHVKKYHDSNAKFRFTCKDCGRGFDFKAMFRAHQQIHSGEKPWVCEYCGQGFRTKHIFKTHLNRHTDSRPHKCPYCEKSFRQVTTLKTHQRTHTGVKPYVCHECGKSFSDLSNYHSHRRSNHNNLDLKTQHPPSRRTRIRKQSTPMSSNFGSYPHIPSVLPTRQQEQTMTYQGHLSQIFHHNNQKH